MPYVYILQNNKGKYYIGSTTNIEKRIKHHKKGYSPSTSKMGHVELVLKLKYNTLSEARIVEMKLKKLKRHDYIKKIVEDGYIRMCS